MGMGSKERAAAAASRAQMQSNIDRAVKELEEVGVPTVEAQQIAIAKFAPEMQEEFVAEELGPSAIEGVAPAQEYVEAQKGALRELQKRGEVGFTEEDRAAREDLLDSIAAKGKSAQASILQGMQQKGLGGSGAELIAQLQSQQSGVNRAAEEGRDLAAAQAAAKRDAIMQAGKAAGDLRSTERTEDMSVAKSRDAIREFNLAQRQRVDERNILKRQEMEEQRLKLEREQEKYNKGLLGTQYQQRLEKAKTMAQARTGVAQMYGQQAAAQGQAAGARRAATMGLIGSALGASAKSSSADGGIRYAEGGIEPTRPESHSSYVGDAKQPEVPSSKISEMAIKEIAKIAKQHSPEENNKYSNGGLGLDPSMLNPYAAIAKEIGKKVGGAVRDYGALRAKADAAQFAGDDISNIDIVGNRPSAQAKMPEFNPEASSNEGSAIGSGIGSLAGLLSSKLSSSSTEEPEAAGKHGSDGSNMYLADGGTKYDAMGYEEGGLETEGRIVPEENYAGDELDDKINSGEMVINISQQERLNNLLQEKNRLDEALVDNEEDGRVDERLEHGELEVNPAQQEALMAVLRGEMDVEDLPNESIIENSEEKESRMRNLMDMIGME